MGYKSPTSAKHRNRRLQIFQLSDEIEYAVFSRHARQLQPVILHIKKFMTEESRIEEFRKIANAKGYTFEFSKANDEETSGASPQPWDHEVRNIHYDTLMVDQSIRDAIGVIEASLEKVESEIRATRERLRGKLVRLLENGSAYEKATFVFTSGSYYFPEDVEAMAASAAASVNNTSHEVSLSCQNLCYMVCRCLYKEQQCRQMCRWVCG